MSVGDFDGGERRGREREREEVMDGMLGLGSYLELVLPRFSCGRRVEEIDCENLCGWVS